MQLEAAIAVAQPADAVRAQAEAFLESRGYRRSAAAFARGSLWGTLSALDPRRWKASVTMKTLSTGHVGVRFDVNTIGHLRILPSEQKFWEDELSGVAAVLKGEAPPNLDALDAATKAEGRRTVGVVLGTVTSMSVACGIAQVIGASRGVSLPPYLVGVGAGVGMLVGLGVAARTGTTDRPRR